MDKCGLEPALELIRAAESNDEREVKRLLNDRVAVNKTDDQGKTALFYAVQNGSKNIVELLIEAGADVEAKDNQDKTALFYAAANKSIKDECSILEALVEKGDALVNATDIYGRTPLFYAITNSPPLTQYLLDHEANLHAEDKSNVSILTCLVEYCLLKQQSSANLTLLSEILHLLLDKGLERQNIVQSVVNLVFCKVPLSCFSIEKETSIPEFLKIRKEDILNTLNVAVDYVDENAIEKKELIIEVEERIRSGAISEALESLSKLRANPNSTDSAGNTALHYTTILPLMGVPQESVMKICKVLMRKGVLYSKPNHQSQTPLLFCLSENNWNFSSDQRPEIKTLIDVCSFLLKNGSKLNETLQSKEAVFHLMMKLFQQELSINDKVLRQDILQGLIKVFQIFCEKEEKQGKMGNKHNDSGNSPLHLWATLTLPSPQDYKSNISENYTFEKLLKLILDSLRKCGANVNDRNNENETPLHLCRTWTAVKLLIDAEANPKDMDSSGRSPLLVAAKSKAFLKHQDRLYPDFTDDPKAFWKNALQKGLDLWTADKQGESVLSTLIKADASVLSRDLVKAAAREDVEDDKFFVSLLNTIYKDGDKHWKEDVVGDIIKLRKSLSTTGLEEALRLCFRNVIEISKANDRKKDSEDSDSEISSHRVHCEIAERLILHGADPKAPSSYGLSCLQMSEACPVLKDLLSKPTPKSIVHWNPCSKRYEETLKKVSRKLETKAIRNISYHKDPIAYGAFGFVFVGISERDGREVAIKRIQNLKLNEEEMKNLTRLADCEQVVRYLYFFPEKDFSYMILELMEGTLDEYLECPGDFDESKSVQLCKDVVMGLRFLHDHPIPILHRDLKPANILYKTHPILCLKIADFGLSLLTDSSSNEDNGKQVGTKCWRAPEILGPSNNHSVSSDMFSCGLLLHYILSKKKHPFSQPRGSEKFPSINQTDNNIRDDEMKGWDSSLSPEATHLVQWMLQHDDKNRPTAGEALNHPMFWSKEEMMDFLKAVGNEPEFLLSSQVPSAIETDLEKSFETVVSHDSWKDDSYSDMHSIYAAITQSGMTEYNTHSLSQLVRFIQTAHSHGYVSSVDRQKTPVKKMLLEDFVFLKNFPKLFMEVYKVVTNHGWDEQRKEVKSVIYRHRKQSSLLSPSVNPRQDRNHNGHTPWISVSKTFESRLSKVAGQQECLTVDAYRYHENPIASGQFGYIYAGISVNDGREVAIKRIEKKRMRRPQDKREVINLTNLADCQQVVRYLCFLDEENDEFSYVVLELMEGNLKQYLNGSFDPEQSVQLCQDVIMGMKYLHEHNILHRDLKPGNILYKIHPKLSLKLADFGLSRRKDITGFSTVYSLNSGPTKCWIAPEVLSQLLNPSVNTHEHSELSDMFSCGLVLHYILSVKRHPFSPADCAIKGESQPATNTEDNIVNDNMVGWDDSLSPEATHLVLKMLKNSDYSRLYVGEALKHPFFWSKQKKIDFLSAVGNQPEFQIPRSRRSLPLSEVETVLESRMGTIVGPSTTWINRDDDNMVAIFNEMTRKRQYATSSVVELVRFIRNAYAHVSTNKQATPVPIKKLLLEDYVFLDYFPKLFMEVYHAVTTFHWSTTREEIKYAMAK